MCGAMWHFKVQGNVQVGTQAVGAALQRVCGMHCTGAWQAGCSSVASCLLGCGASMMQPQPLCCQELDEDEFDMVGSESCGVWPCIEAPGLMGV
jgi:hypothetical protein